jgi:peptidoglycan/LPS O-acetylase OafA/YrhL
MAWYFRVIKIPVWLLISSLIFVLYLVFVPYMMTNLYLNHLLVILLTVIIVLGLKKRSKLDDLLGELTYSTYLLHMPVMDFVSLLMAKYQSTVAFVVTYLASIIVVKYIESPLDKKRKKMTTKLLDQAENRSEEKSVESMSIMVLILLFLLISGGYNLLWLSANPPL